MADKSVGELAAATGVTPTDLFVLEQSGTAKKLTGQILENWLVSFADGHGGIQSIEKLSTSGLVDTYRITLADTTTFDFVVNNGRGITGISKTGTSGLVDTYTISYNDGTSGTFTVKNGEKGDKGDNVYTWVKYASQEPTEESHSMGDIPDDWRGEYNGPLAEAPTDWKQYKWYKIKGEQGNTGDPATIVSQSVAYQVSDSGTIIPSGTWETSVPVVGQGKYLWTRSTITYNTGSPVVSYSVSRMGIDGSGSVSSVAGVSPDETGNVTLTASDVGALAASGGDMTGAINMNGQPISGLNDPTEESQAARKGYVDKMLPKTGGTMSGSIAMGGNRITDLGTPAANTDAATKGYADLAAYPVGAIYISTVSTSPASLFGGTWEQIKDRFLYSVGDTAFAGQQGGEISHTLTVNEMPVHYHPLGRTGDHTAYAVTWGNINASVEIPSATAVTHTPGQALTGANSLGVFQYDDHVTANSGGGLAHNNMPPYLSVYMWQRVA